SIFSPPFRGGFRWFSPFPPKIQMKGRQLPGKRHFLEKFLKKLWPVARAARNNKFRPAGRRPTGRKQK
ncbi:hypothetical protein RA263_29655, partial [Pseudomonas syringae pv. tagetis]|uniref:hypothetical protein n=1 Tax=Pseudomonas syringae group genomosp. 7 TaxID=251699 RepID=UPI003770378D